MNVRLHPHAEARLVERGESRDQVIRTVLEGERFLAKFGRSGFRRNFAYDKISRPRHYANMQVEAIGVEEEGWLVITVMVRFF